jgi:hypothetical protein
VLSVVRSSALPVSRIIPVARAWHHDLKHAIIENGSAAPGPRGPTAPPGTSHADPAPPRRARDVRARPVTRTSRRRRPTRTANRSGPTRPTPRDRPHRWREGTLTS